MPITLPNPSQVWHAPKGLLKLKKFTEGSVNDIPSNSNLSEKDNILNENINAIQPETLDRVKMLSGAFVNKGYDIASATKGAYGIISRSIYAQATFLTYKDLFVYLGFFFLLLIPLLVMFKEKKKKLIEQDEVMEWDVVE
jgi:hypothetical protein